MMVEQFGLAMIPLWVLMASGLISGITRGTSGSIRKADELSTTTAPASTAAGANSFAPPPTGAEQRDLDALETVLRQFLNRIFLTLEGDLLTLGAAAGKHLERAEREVTLFENTQEFLTDRTGHSCNCQLTSHVHKLLT